VEVGRSSDPPLITRPRMDTTIGDLVGDFQCTFFPVQILVVDDDVTARAAIRRLLEQQGYSVIVAEDAPDALRLLERTHVPVDMLVTDIQMPGMNGDRLAARVRESWPELPVIFVSGEIRNAVLADHAGGRTRFVLKPFLPVELLEAIRVVLELPGIEQPEPLQRIPEPAR